jgi:hypothetical protein
VAEEGALSVAGINGILPVKLADSAEGLKHLVCRFPVEIKYAPALIKQSISGE